MAEPTLDLERFIASLGDPYPPVEANLALRALWYDANGRQESAERAANADEGLNTLRVRAYLLRKQGKEGPARIAYWKAGAKPWEGSAETEWRDIAQQILIEFPVAAAYGS